MVASTPAKKLFSVTLRVWRQAGPAAPGKFVDYPAKDVNPDMSFLELIDVVNDEITVKGDPTTGKSEPRFVLEADLDQLGGDPTGQLRVLGPFDPYLQLRDRELLVDDEGRRKDVWRVLGRPGAIVVDGAVVGTWRPKTSGNKLTMQADLWRTFTRAAREQLGELLGRSPGDGGSGRKVGEARQRARPDTAFRHRPADPGDEVRHRLFGDRLEKRANLPEQVVMCLRQPEISACPSPARRGLRGSIIGLDWRSRTA